MTATAPQPRRAGAATALLVLLAVSVICAWGVAAAVFLAHWLLDGANGEGWGGFAITMGVITAGVFAGLCLVAVVVCVFLLEDVR